MDHDPPPLPYGPPRTSGMATASLVLGICSIIFSILTALPALILGTVALVKINNSAGRLKGSGLAIGGIVTGAVLTLISVPLLLPAISAAREAAFRNVSLNNMKLIGLALQQHVDMQRSFPAAGGGEGRGAQLSWRVHILPYMEQASLYEQFHLDEPWDSEHNRKLIPQMPNEFKDPAGKLPEGKTAYLAVTGPGTAFGDGRDRPTISDFKNGITKTVLIVEADADEAVTWTKPEDWQFDPVNPKRGLGKHRPGGFVVGFADSHTDFINNDTPPDAIKAMMTRDPGDRFRLQ